MPHSPDELRWVPMDRLSDTTIPYVAAAIESWRRGEWFGAFGWNDGCSACPVFVMSSVSEE